MTDKEKSQAAKDHSGLVTQLAHKFWVTYKDLAERDDFIGEAFVGAAYALNKYDHGRGRRVGSYIYLCVVNHLSTFVKDMMREKRFDPNIQMVSIDTCVDDESMHDLLPSRSNIDIEVLDKIEYEYIASQLTDQERELLEWIIEGLPLSDYALMIGKEKRTVCDYRNKLREKIAFLIDKFN